MVFAITAMVLTTPLSAQWAQTAPEGLESNTYRATAGLFRNEVDNFADTRYWSNVTFDKWFGFATGGQTTGANVTGGTGAGAITKGSLGYAGKFGNLYLGAWYNGNITQITGGSAVQTITGTDDPVTQTQTSTVTATTYASAWANSTNQLSLLFGIGDMGFKVGFFESLATDKNPAAPTAGRAYTVTDTHDGVIGYANETVEYSLLGGYLRPSLGWGMSVSGFKPYVDLAFDIYQEEKIDSSKNYTTANGQIVGAETTTAYAGWNRGYIAPDLTVGADIDIPGSAFTSTVGLKYGLNFRLYNNSYDVAGFSGNAKGPVNWNNTGNTTVTRYIDRTITATSATLTFADTTNWNHAITPSYKIAGEPLDGFKLGFKMTLPVTINARTQDNYSEAYSNTRTVYNNNVNLAQNTTQKTLTRNNNDLVETTTFGIALTANVGASYKLIPNRFTVNAGISATPLSYSHTVMKTSPNGVRQTTTNTTVDGYGVTTAETVTVTTTPPLYNPDSVDRRDTWAQFTGSALVGFVFEFTPQLFVDLYATAAGANFNVNIANVNVLFGFKF